jgi:hypothetical protein
VAEAHAAGVGRRRLRHPSLRTPTSGIRTIAPPPSPGAAGLLHRCAELLPVLLPGAAFCHVTALDLLRVDRPFVPGPDDRLHVQVPPGSAWPRRAGLVGHTRAAVLGPDRLLVSGIPVLDPVAVWVQLAGTLPVRELVVLGDALVRRAHPWTTVAGLRRRVERTPTGTRGVRRLRTAVELVRPRTDSPMETRLRLTLIEAGLPCPVVNHRVLGRSGEHVAMPDLAYVPQRIAIEYDGDVHRTDARTWRRDIARRQGLEALGWRVITCTADDVLRDPDRAVGWVRTALRPRA